MRKELRTTELDRIRKNPQTWVALMIGCGISILHIFHNLVKYVGVWNEMALNLKDEMQYPLHLFGQWICGNTYNLEGFLYFMVFPLLAVLPHSLSFMEDKESGYATQVYVRCERKEYLKAKFSSVFLSGGIVVVLPLILNFCICAAMLPALRPQNAAGTFINTSVLWYSIYENYPVLYVAIFFLLDFIAGGLNACLPLFLSYYSEKKFVIVLMPFVIHIFLYSVAMMTAIPNAVQYTPVYFLFSGIGCPSEWLIVLYFLVYFGIGGVLFWRIGRTEDVF